MATTRTTSKSKKSTSTSRTKKSGTSKKTKTSKTTTKKTGTKKATTRKKAVKAKAPKTAIETKTIEVPELPIETSDPVDASIETISTGINDAAVDVEEIPQPVTTPIPIQPQIIADSTFDISRKVLARIASLAAGEINGLVPPKKDPVAKFLDSIRGRVDGIRVDVGTTEAAVDMLVRVTYGSDIQQITDHLRECVARRINEMTGLNVVEINVRIQDVTPAEWIVPAQ